MLTITVPASEYYDENTQTFVYVKESSLILEHSLISISKWESNWNKAFLSDITRCCISCVILIY